MRNWSSDAQTQLLPQAGFYPLSTVFERARKLVCWRDDNYGDCYIANDSNVFELITERSPRTPKPLCITASNVVGLGIYAEEKFNLAVPPIA